MNIMIFRQKESSSNGDLNETLKRRMMYAWFDGEMNMYKLKSPTHFNI